MEAMSELGCGGSFSFSCSDSDVNFSSALSHFTDDIDGDTDGEDDESYIEISLDHHHHHNSKESHDVCDGESLHHVDYLRISFSLSFPFPEFSVDHIATQDDVVAAATSSSTTTAMAASSVEDFGGCDHDERDVVKDRKSKLPAVNRLVNTLFFSLWSSSSVEPTAKKGLEDYSIRLPQPHVDNDDFVRTRRVSIMKKTTVNRGIMKKLFKFRAMNLGTLVASFVKPRKLSSRQPDQDQCHFTYQLRKKKKQPKPQSPIQHEKTLDKFFVKKKPRSAKTELEKPRVVLESKKLNRVRGVLEAIGSSMSRTSVKKERRLTRSCPSSIKSSPIHKEFVAADQSKMFARETSIQAAIAHCRFSSEKLS